jgi:hypothetical protein
MIANTSCGRGDSFQFLPLIHRQWRAWLVFGLKVVLAFSGGQADVVPFSSLMSRQKSISCTGYTRTRYENRNQSQPSRRGICRTVVRVVHAVFQRRKQESARKRQSAQTSAMLRNDRGGMLADPATDRWGDRAQRTTIIPTVLASLLTRQSNQGGLKLPYPSRGLRYAISAPD